jgi:Fe-S-cluster containining protein
MTTFKIININLTSVISNEPISDVPCGPCTKCCEIVAPYLTPEEVSSGIYPISIINPSAEHVAANPECGPTVTIFKKTGGGCGMLVDKKCTIYYNRPIACRQFDCRKGHWPALNEHAKQYFGEKHNENSGIYNS